MGTRSHLILLAETYARHRSITEATVSKHATGHANTIARLREGADITVGRAERALTWFERNWPGDLAWPVGVPRPSNPVFPLPASA